MFIDFQGIINARELGGMTSEDGRKVKKNCLLRCGELEKATDEDIRRLQEAYNGEKFRAAALQKRIFAAIADSYINQENVLHFEPGLESAQVRELADLIANHITGFAAVFSGEDGSYNYCLITREGDLRQLGKDMTTALNGRGGGKPLAQQGSVKATQAQIEAFFKNK